MKQKGKI